MAALAGRARNRSTDIDQGRFAAAQERVGILSRTLNSSSSIRWILPARIRSPSKNDVVFVGHTFIQLHEFHDSGQLVDTTAKLDFGTTIFDAKIISADLNTVPIIDAILKQERDFEQYSIRGQSVDDDQPPQLLVLITQDNELIYVYARETPVGDVQLVFAKRPFLRGAGLPPSQCRHVAVDPQSRALAVASSSGYFGVFKLRDIDEIKTQIDGWDPQNSASFRPSEEQRYIQIDGKILLMSFLPSPESDPDKVILLLLVYSNDQRKETYQYLYKWDVRHPLQTIKPMTGSGRMLRDKQLPTMLIPSTRAYAYMVVMPSGISYYENIQASEVKRVNCEFAPDPKGELEWTQWSRPRRHTKYLQRRDDIVVLREDGLLRNFLIDKHSSTQFSTNNTIGHLGFSVDTAFCMLSGPPGKGGDILIVSGSMTDGGVFHVSARKSPERIQTIDTIAPLNDLVTGPPIALGSADAVVQQGLPGRLYTCSGPHDRRGQVTELRYGLEAQIGWTMEYPDAAMIDRLFSLELPGIDELFLLASHTTNSSMVTFELETQDICVADSELYAEFDFDHPTLAATVINRDTIIQVTTTGARAILVGADGSITKLRHLRSKFAQAVFFEEDQTIAVTRQNNAVVELCLLDIETSKDGRLHFAVSPPVRLQHPPSSVCCFKMQGDSMIVVGTATGDLLCYNKTLELLFQDRVDDLHPGLKNAAITSVVALSPKAGGPTLLLCGLRSGTLLCLEIKACRDKGPMISVRCDESFQLGTTTVEMVQEKGRSGSLEHPSALVLCAHRAHRVTLHPNTAVVDYSMSPLWVTDRTKPSAQLSINAMHRIPKLESGSAEPGGFLMCATESELLFCSVVAQEHGIARQLYLDGIPKRLLYSHFLQKLCVAFSREGIPEALPARARMNVPLPPGEKDAADCAQGSVQRIGLQLVTTDMKHPLPVEGGNSFSTIITEDNSEIVHDFIDWKPTDGKKHFEWLVLALEQPMIALPGPGKGRVVCINAKSLGKGNPHPGTKVAYESHWESVTAICAYKESSLLIACGKEIVVRHLDFKTERWQTPFRHALPSQANAISCQGSLICVATKEHSLFVLVERNNQLQQHNCEAKMRYAKDIAVLDSSTAVFASADSEGTDIIGFTGMNKETSEAIPLFHAKLPGHIHCFRMDTSIDTRQKQRTRFYGATIDGMIFHFSLLRQKEWKLLHFIEEMSDMNRKGITAVPMKMRDGNNQQVLWKTPSVKPKDMHVRGDRLLRMIDGTYNLRDVLKGSDRRAHFASLVEEVLGETEEPVEVAIAWMRKLLRYPPR